MRFAGSRPLSTKVRLNYSVSYARQSDYHRNPNDYVANYYALEAGLDVAALKLGIAYGSEWDAMVAAKRGRWTATAKLADYRARRFATDTRKIWLMIEWAY